ncbi:DUF2214 family protein [Aurantiacibacter spongiae]|uniref:DUF2214 family protein n=2 Tax=Aurantiacibacter spongiae TaxID=2488860 RepID=A0A3N5DTG4_9SPHN|nr:DUF2214 family protein [Aurantiacibacter spongiae]
MHVVGLVTVFGTILVVDLRLMGLASRTTEVKRLMGDVLPWTWSAFALAALSGLAMFASHASLYVANPWFLAKMGLLALAGLNMAIFQFATTRRGHSLPAGATPPHRARVAGALSLVLWVAVVFCGRAIGFTLGIYS